ncbi:MAG: hypothetical protein JW885_05510 [Deltaproteobacteria bacterium]|nr:hypothetical protein [Candidatus Zymogenaceae bacterium]
MRCFVLVLSFFALLFLSGVLPVVRFTEEQIDITVYPDRVHVRGTYVYDNFLPFPVIQGLTVPLPIDQDNPSPVLIRVAALKPAHEPFPVRYLLGAYRCEVTVPPRDSVTIMVEYIQYAPNKNACYLLTTTRLWRRAIERGEFRLMPEGVEIIHSTYPLIHADTHVLFFQKEDFMPTEDWDFSWKVIEDDEA